MQSGFLLCPVMELSKTEPQVESIPSSLPLNGKLLTLLLITLTLCSIKLHTEESVNEWRRGEPELCQESPVFDLF